MKRSVASVAISSSVETPNGEVRRGATGGEFGVCAAAAPSQVGVVGEEADPSRPRRDLTVDARRAVPST